MNEIKLITAPVIAHKVTEIGAEVSARIIALNLDNQVATVDTVKSLKELRATLNKEFAEFEIQRKTLKSAILNPYDEFEALYKFEISEKYNNAIDLLKNKIDSVEMQIKKEKETNLREYFAELCQVEKLDWLYFDQLNLKIDLSTTEKKLKEQINEAVAKIQEELGLIAVNPYQAEILVIYKQTLNVAQAIRTITERKEAEKLEEDRLRDERINNRKKALIAIGMKYEEMTELWAYDAKIFISAQEVELLDAGKFAIEYNNIKQAIAQAKVESEITPTPVEVVAAPVVEKEEPIITSRIEIKATRDKLLKLSAYLKENGYIYSNIKN